MDMSARRPRRCRAGSAPATATSSTPFSRRARSGTPPGGQRDWAQKPKPKVNAQRQAVATARLIARQTIMYDMMFLAIQPTPRVFMTVHTTAGGEVIPIKGVQQGYHQLSHHGLDGGKIEQLD